MNYLKILIFSFFTFPVIAGEGTSSLLIYGDSISAGYGMDKEEQWSRDLEVLFKKDNFKIKIFNSSVSGETTGGGVSRINKVLDELKPSYVLLELGGNDALRGYPPDKIYQNLMTMINACKDRGIEVFDANKNSFQLREEISNTILNLFIPRFLRLQELL